MSFTPPSFTDILGQSYAQLPQESQLLLATSILGIPSSWLSQSFLSDSQKLLRSDKGKAMVTGGGDMIPTVIVSFMNDHEFYKGLVRRMGIDLPTLSQKKQFAFVDAFSNLFSTNTPTPTTPSVDQSPSAFEKQTQLAGIQKAIETSISSLTTPSSSSSGSSKKPRLIIESPDVLTSAACIPAQVVVDMLLDLREQCSVTLVSVSADSVLINPMMEGERAGKTELEIEQATLVSTLAHVADAVIGLRRLDTGVAQDVTGVVRVTRGGGLGWRQKGSGGGTVEEREVLYYIDDRDVKLFGRGESR